MTLVTGKLVTKNSWGVMVEANLPLRLSILETKRCDVLYAKPCVAVCGDRVIDPSEPAEPAFDRSDRSKGAGGGRGSDREGQHRKMIMGVGPIGKLDAIGGDESRTLLPLRPKAATAPKPQNSDPEIDPVFGERVAGQRGTQTVVDQGGAYTCRLTCLRPSILITLLSRL